MTRAQRAAAHRPSPNARSAGPTEQPPPGVTSRQMACLYWVQHGKSASDIGGILGISGRTVEGHLNKVCGHFGVRTRFQAVLLARDLGLLGNAP